MTKRKCTILFIVINVLNVDGNKKQDGVIYILIWTSVVYEPFNFIDMGYTAFKNCLFKNCYLTADHNYFEDILDFDVLMFIIINLRENIKLPSKRSPEQKYCMYGLDAAIYHLIPEKYNGFFNITFTYKLDSNVTIPYVVVKDENGEVIGPKIGMKWKKLNEMNETSDYVKDKLRNKSIAAAWIVSHCESVWRRIYVDLLQEELSKFGHSIDVFGKCGTKLCPKGDYGVCGTSRCPKYERMDECLSYVESDYYFYLAFENSFTEDYVSEKVLHGLQHFTVPVVLGKANYSRFMPDGIYLNANVLSPDELAAQMNEIIKDPNKYHEYFKWHDHYTFHFSGEDRYSREICNLCSFLNESVNKSSTYENISAWWWDGEEAEIPYYLLYPKYAVQPVVEEKSAVEKIFTNVLSFLDPSD